MRILLSSFLLFLASVCVAQTANDSTVKKREQKKYKEIITEYTQLLAVDSNYKDGFFNRGIAYCKSGQCQEAISDFSKVIAKDSTDYVAFFYRGYSKYEIKDYVGCIEDCNQCIRIRPDYAIPYSYRGMAEYNEGINKSNIFTNPKALADCDTAVSLIVSPKNHTDSLEIIFIYYNRAELRNFHDDLQNAIADYTSSIRMDPNVNILSYFGRSYCYTKLKKYSLAIADYDILIASFPDSYLAYRERGELKAILHEKEAACADFQTVLKLGGYEKYEEQRLKKLIKKNCN